MTKALKFLFNKACKTKSYKLSKLKNELNKLNNNFIYFPLLNLYN